MSASWNLVVLCRPENLDPPTILSFIDCLKGEGYGNPPYVERSYATTADGTGSLLFSSLDAAVGWLATGEGLVSLRNGTSNLELSVSIHRHDGILATEMRQLPDTPLFDVVTISTSQKDLLDPSMETWSSVKSTFRRALPILPIEFGYGMAESAFEALITFLCAHRRIVEHRFPPFLPWFSVVPKDSRLSAQLKNASVIMSRPIEQSNGLCFMQLTDSPDGAAHYSVVAASQKWRFETRDPGCAVLR